MKKLLSALAVGVILNCVGVGAETISAKAPDVITPTTAVFAWDGVEESDISILERHRVDTIFLDINHADDIGLLNGFNIFLLAGDPTWGLNEMQSTVEQAAGVYADGVVFDIESNYRALAQNLEQLQQKSNITIYVCIPYWLDEVDEDILERIVRADDGIVVMNYNRTAERQQMDTEIKLAQKYHKYIWHAVELQESGMYGLEPINTYYGVGGIDAAEENYSRQFKDTTAGFAIHNLEMLRKIE